ncbi:CBS domain-containing protein [Desulfobacterales bacterium HSG16]|nr:CBS domain-containing protein [Desulfobacterales bacterium HSG16]
MIFPKKDLTVITTHINADFDAVASMFAAQKLYPDALVVFPGSHEKNLRNFFIQSMVYLCNMTDIKDIDFDNVHRLVLVDTRQPKRIGKFAALIEQDDVEIHIYDHHPDLADDIKGKYEVVEMTGATASILTDIIKETGINITADEATIIGLGIYEDTGSFTFSSTTEADFLAAAYLVSKGANLDVIANLIAREISPVQVSILNDMFQSLTRYNIGGVEVAVSTISTDQYVADFAFLVHKMVKMENLNAIFALARMDHKVYVVARSRSSEVDAGSIVKELGGGGHAFAAAATIRDKTLTQTEQILMDLLHKNVKSNKLAHDLMSSPAITVDEKVTCEEARHLLTRYNINALIVTRKNKGTKELLGYIARQVISKVIYLELKEFTVGEYMTPEPGRVSADAQLPEIQRQIIDNKQRVLPVVENDEIVGVITRTDLLNTLVQEQSFSGQHPPDPFRKEVNARRRNVLHMMEERLSDNLLDLLKGIGSIADNLGYGVYVVGGFVRDLFLYRKNEDVDIVIEGSGIKFAAEYAKTHQVRTHAYSKFGTAVIIFPDGFKIDVASARMEHYRFPADLPTVEMSSIKLDLFRRDFTVNTLSIQLNPDHFGILIDFFSAQKDIKEKAIRVMHNLSFVEDPTRVYRAIRFEQRFGFNLGKPTVALIKSVVKMDFFPKLSGRRVFNELRQILEEENPAPAIKRLDDYGLLTIIHPNLKPDQSMLSLLESVKKVLSWHKLLYMQENCNRWAVYFMAMIAKCDGKASEAICDKLEIVPRFYSVFCKERFDLHSCLYWMKNNMPVQNSKLYRKLNDFRLELILFLMAAAEDEEIKKSISFYVTRLKNTRTSIRGRDLMRMNIEPGPIYREILTAVLDARLDGHVKTRHDELNFVRHYVSCPTIKNS